MRAGGCPGSTRCGPTAILGCQCPAHKPAGLWESGCITPIHVSLSVRTHILPLSLFLSLMGPPMGPFDSLVKPGLHLHFFAPLPPPVRLCGGTLGSWLPLEGSYPRKVLFGMPRESQRFLKPRSGLANSGLWATSGLPLGFIRSWSEK